MFPEDLLSSSARRPRSAAGPAGRCGTAAACRPDQSIDPRRESTGGDDHDNNRR